MIWTTVVIVMGLPVIVLIAWIMWLSFATLIAHLLGIEGLKVLDKVGRAFRPLEWASLATKARRTGAR